VRKIDRGILIFPIVGVNVDLVGGLYHQLNVISVSMGIFGLLTEVAYGGLHSFFR